MEERQRVRSKNRLRTMIENGTVRGLMAYDGF
jgi:hypothetical protein